jgi:2,3-bisphosphoglycerate-independent phosphoglycerate mutase
MAAACLVSFAILAGGLAALYGLDWYKNRKSTKDVEKEYTDKEPLAEQLA